MLQNGTPPDKFKVLYFLSPMKFQSTNKEIDFYGLSPLVYCVISLFKDGEGPNLVVNLKANPKEMKV